MLYSIKIQYSPEYKPVVKYWSVQVFQRGAGVRLTGVMCLGESVVIC